MQKEELQIYPSMLPQVVTIRYVSGRGKSVVDQPSCAGPVRPDFRENETEDWTENADDGVILPC